MASNGRGHEGNFWGSRNVLNLDLGGGYLGECICKNSSICYSRNEHNIVNQLYFNKIKKNHPTLHLDLCTLLNVSCKLKKRKGCQEVSTLPDYLHLSPLCFQVSYISHNHVK